MFEQTLSLSSASLGPIGLKFHVTYAHILSLRYTQIPVRYSSPAGIFWPTLSTKLKSPCSFRPNGFGDNVERFQMFYRGHNAEDDVAGPRSAEPRRRPVLSTARTPISGIAEPQTTPEQMHKRNANSYSSWASITQ